MYNLSPEFDNCPFWICGKNRITAENISWFISTKECCPTRRRTNTRPPDLVGYASEQVTEVGLICFNLRAYKRDINDIFFKKIFRLFNATSSSYSTWWQTAAPSVHVCSMKTRMYKNMHITHSTLPLCALKICTTTCRVRFLSKKKQEYRWNRWMLPEHAIVGTGNIILDKERYTVYTHCTSKWSITKPVGGQISFVKLY